MSIVLAFKEYKIFKDVFGSEWTGYTNFSKLFADAAFRNALENTIILKIEYILFSSVTAFLLGLAISCLHSLKLRSLLAGISLIPYFIPSSVFAYAVLLWLSPSQLPVLDLPVNPLLDDRLFPLLLVFVETFKNIGIPLLLVLAAINYKQVRETGNELADTTSFRTSHVLPAARVIAAYAIFQFSALLTTNFELLHNLLTPLTYASGETLDTYGYKKVFLQGNYSLGGALWLFKFVIQLLFTFVVYVLIKRWFSADLFGSSETFQPHQNVKGKLAIMGRIAAWLFAGIVSVVLVMLLIYPFLQRTLGEGHLSAVWSTSRAALYVVIYAITSIVSMLVVLTLAYPLTVRNLPGRGVYKLILLFVVVIGSNSLSDYLLFKSMGMINTVFPVGISGFFPLVGTFVLKGIFVRKNIESKEYARAQGYGELLAFFKVFIPRIWKQLLALGILQFTTLWNSYYSSMLYLTDPKIAPPVMYFRRMQFDVKQAGIQAFDPVILQYGALLCLPPLVLYVLFHRWLTAEVLLSQVRKGE